MKSLLDLLTDAPDGACWAQVIRRTGKKGRPQQLTALFAHTERGWALPDFGVLPREEDLQIVFYSARKEVLEEKTLRLPLDEDGQGQSLIKAPSPPTTPPQANTDPLGGLATSLAQTVGHGAKREAALLSALAQSQQEVGRLSRELRDSGGEGWSSPETLRAVGEAIIQPITGSIERAVRAFRGLPEVHPKLIEVEETLREILAARLDVPFSRAVFAQMVTEETIQGLPEKIIRETSLLYLAWRGVVSALSQGSS